MDTPFRHSNEVAEIARLPQHFRRSRPLSNAEYDEVCAALDAFNDAWAATNGRGFTHKAKNVLGFSSARAAQSVLHKSVRRIRLIAVRDSEHHRMLLWVAAGRYDANRASKSSKRYRYLEKSLAAVVTC
jgi:hypothetical protein